MEKIVCIGGSTSGALFALHLFQEGFSGEVTLVDPRGDFGAAYCSHDPRHILNVPAGNMGAFADDPLHFWKWAKKRLNDPHLSKEAFLPRHLFAEYLEELLHEAEVKYPLLRVRDEAVAMDREASGTTVHLRSGLHLKAEGVVLALGNFPPKPLFGANDPPLSKYAANPWEENAFSGITTEDPVLFVGTGLTMVDGVLTLLGQGHKGPIFALSRRGLLPLTRTFCSPLPMTLEDFPQKTVSSVMRVLRQKAREAADKQMPWDAVMDGVRPWVQALWQRFSLEEKRRFLRHACPWWDIHRHRAPSQSIEVVHEAMKRGQMQVMAGRLRSCLAQEDEDLVRVRWTPKGKERQETLLVKKIINCTGPSGDYRIISHPLIKDLFQKGLAAPHPLGLGFSATAQGEVLGTRGQPSEGLFALGPPLKGVLWEIIAVPDIRVLAQKLAMTLAASETSSLACRG